jgi:hypothetical protein
MNAPNDGGPAFPAIGSRQEGEHGDYHMVVESYGGMTLRDYFAAKAMQAMCSGTWPDGHERPEIAARSFSMADAMLKARDS